VAGVGGHQLILHAFELAQPHDAIRRVAAIEPLESDQALFLANRAAGLGEHQLQGGTQARLIELVDQSLEMETKVRGPPFRRTCGGVGRPQSIALHQ
jgi:hypothetical protein